jgi:hypothetical protein
MSLAIQRRRLNGIYKVVAIPGAIVVIAKVAWPAWPWLQSVELLWFGGVILLLGLMVRLRFAVEVVSEKLSTALA